MNDPEYIWRIRATDSLLKPTRTITLLVRSGRSVEEAIEAARQTAGWQLLIKEDLTAELLSAEFLGTLDN